MEKSYRLKYGSSKRATQAINRFNYYLQDIIPQIFQELTPQNQAQSPNIKSTIAKNNLVFFWSREHIQGESLVNEHSIFNSIKSTHLSKNSQHDQITKINEGAFQKNTTISTSFFGILSHKYTVSEVIEFVLNSLPSEKGKIPTYELYIIHHCQNKQAETNSKVLKWLHYVQKYIFMEQGTKYETIAVINEQISYLSKRSKKAVFRNFMRNYIKFEKLQGYLLQYKQSIKQKIKKSEDPAFNQEHKLCKQIPVQFLKMLDNLKKQFGEENEQLICRYMMGRQYKIQQIRKSIKEYLKWYQQYSKYKWQDFEQFHKMKIFYYLGEDYKGRPVILNKAKNVLVDKIDAQRYCKYYMYYLEMYLAQKMRGYVTQLNIIADVENIGNANFKFAITKRNVDDGKRYCVERQYKFFAVNISSFALFAYRFIKPLLPKKTQEKVYIGGNNIKQIFQNLNKDMSQNVIPTYLGGKNPII